jgi:hypothetical protein
MDKISNNSACVIGVIALIAVVPRYIELPKSLELLFHDTIGQLLLLLLAITVGSYNFTCGVLLAVLFLSVMLQSKRMQNEGFIDYEEGDDKDMELNENFDSAAKKKASKKTEEDKETEMETESTPAPTKRATKPNVVDDLKEEIKESQKKIKDLESKLKESESKKNNKMDEETEVETANAEPEESTEMETEPTVEGFSCGCNNDNRRTKMIKYAEAGGMIETFENPTPTEQIQMDCYDFAGCKYQNGYTPFNDSFYGPPVDSCHAYRKANVNATGTVFYPLN